MKKLLIILLLVFFTASCNSLPITSSSSDGDGSGVSTLQEIAQAQAEAEGVTFEEVLFYGLGAIVLLVGIGFAVALKNPEIALYAFGGCLLVVAVPFLISALQALKWIVIVAAGLAILAILAYIIYKVKGIIDDLTEPDRVNKHRETDKIIKAKNESRING